LNSDVTLRNGLAVATRVEPVIAIAPAKSSRRVTTTAYSLLTIAGREVSHLERGNFVGEVAFLTDRPATATVIAEGPVLTFERGKLSQLFYNEAEVAGLIYQLLGRELAHKITISNTLLSTGTA
jgi:CRP-like cAMP-binding protein